VITIEIHQIVDNSRTIQDVSPITLFIGQNWNFGVIGSNEEARKSNIQIVKFPKPNLGELLFSHLFLLILVQRELTHLYAFVSVS